MKNRLLRARLITIICVLLMERPMALAFFITFSTYGTWLHGTDKAKGSVDRDHNKFGDEFVSPDPARAAAERQVMAQPDYTLDEARRRVVRDAIVEICAEKGWRLLAAHVRSNHVHVIVIADRDPGRLMSDLKARASARLTAAGFESSERKRWTRHGSTLHLFDQAAIAEKIDYTLNRQGVPMAIYDGREEPRTK